MKTINIAGAIDVLNVFDDPEYCTSDSVTRCPFYSGVYQSCILHLNLNDCDIWVPTKLVVDYRDDHFQPTKCDACKAAYQKDNYTAEDRLFDEEYS